MRRLIACFAVVFGSVMAMTAVRLAHSPSPEGALGYHAFGLFIAWSLAIWALIGLVFGPRYAPKSLMVVSVLVNGFLAFGQFMTPPKFLTLEQWFDGAVCLLWAVWFFVSLTRKGSSL